MTVLRSGSASDVGRVRSNNQDLALETSNLFAVADGMGGHVGGEVASRLAVQSLRQAFDRQPSAQGLVDAIGAANQAVWTEGQEQADLRGMGTTLTVAALVQGAEGRDVLALANVGDSRAYVFADGQLSQVTSDHSLAEERVRQGAMTEQEAAVHPHRHILTRALGVGPGVDVDLWELDLKTGDRLLLCSDGLTNEVSDVEIADLLGQRSDPSDAARVLVDLANQHGGNDNITVVVVDVLVGEEGDGSPRPSRPAAATALAAGAGAATVAADEAVAGADPPGPPAATPAGDPHTGSGAGAAGPATAPDDRAGGPGSSGSPFPRNDEGVTSVVPAVGSATANGMRSGDRTRATSTAVAAPPSTTGIVVAPGAPPPPRRPDAKAKRESRRRRRRRQPRAITLRVVLFVLLFAGVVAGAYYFVRWYAMDAYYVTVDQNQLVIYQGRPGGVLWFKPHVVDRTGVTTTQIPAIDVSTVKGQVVEPNLSAARGYVNNLRQEEISQQQLSNGSGPFAGNQAPSVPTTAPPATTTTLPTTDTSVTTTTAPPTGP